MLVFPKQNQNTEADFSYVFSFGLGYISSVLKKEGYHVDCLNLNNYNGTSEELVSKALDQNKYDFVGVSGNVKDVIMKYKQGELKPTDSSNVEGHW